MHACMHANNMVLQPISTCIVVSQSLFLFFIILDAMNDAESLFSEDQHQLLKWLKSIMAYVVKEVQQVEMERGLQLIVTGLSSKTPRSQGYQVVLISIDCSYGADVPFKRDSTFMRHFCMGRSHGAQHSRMQHSATW